MTIIFAFSQIPSKPQHRGIKNDEKFHVSGQWLGRQWEKKYLKVQCNLHHLSTLKD